MPRWRTCVADQSSDHTRTGRVCVSGGSAHSHGPEGKTATAEIGNRIADLRAIDPPREIHFHLNVSPDQLAAILRHHT
jgi:hypothetical protein